MFLKLLFYQTVYRLFYLIIFFKIITYLFIFFQINLNIYKIVIVENNFIILQINFD